MDAVKAHEIMVLHEQGWSTREIAVAVGQSHMSVWRCIDRKGGATVSKSTAMDRHDYFLGGLGDGNYRARVWADDTHGACGTQEMLGSRHYSETPEDVAIALELVEEYEEYIEGDDPYSGDNDAN